MWLSATLLLTMVLTVLEVFILGLHYDPPSTGRIQQGAFNTNHKQGATKLLKLLNKFLVMVTSENGKKYSIRFEMKKKNSIRTAVIKYCHHLYKQQEL